MQRLFGDSIQCNGCGKGIQPQLYDTEQEDGSVLRSFDCARCFRNYPVATITKRGLELTEELQNTPIDNTDDIKRLRKLIKKEVNRP